MLTDGLPTNCTLAAKLCISFREHETKAPRTALASVRDPACFDPEQLLVSVPSNCHMPTYLGIAESQGHCAEKYEAVAVGCLGKIEGVSMAITRIELAPKVVFGESKLPDNAAISRIHAGDYKNCFVGSLIKAKVSMVANAIPA